MSRLYVGNFTRCHGIEGEGSDLGLPLNTADIQSRDAEELIRIISEGVSGTAMVPWHNVLTPDEIAFIVEFLQHRDEIEAEGVMLTPPEPVWVDIDDPESMLELGERIYSTTCVACQGEEGSGGTGPVLNSQQVLTANTDEQLTSTIINGGRRPSSTMPSFGDRLTSVEIEALVSCLRAWEPTAQLLKIRAAHSKVVVRRGATQARRPDNQTRAPLRRRPFPPNTVPRLRGQAQF